MSDAVQEDVRVRQLPAAAIFPLRPPAALTGIESVKNFHKRWEGAPWASRAIASFPDVDPGLSPCGSLILIQLALPPLKIGSLYVPGEVQDNIQWRTQTALVRACGPLAFTRRDTMQPWPEGPWFSVGSFIRGPMYGGDRFKVPIEERDEEGNAREVLFVVINDLHTIAVVHGDPFRLKSDW